MGNLSAIGNRCRLSACARIDAADFLDAVVLAFLYPAARWLVIGRAACPDAAAEHVFLLAVDRDLTDAFGPAGPVRLTDLRSNRPADRAFGGGIGDAFGRATGEAPRTGIDRADDRRANGPLGGTRSSITGIVSGQAAAQQWRNKRQRDQLREGGKFYC